MSPVPVPGGVFFGPPFPPTPFRPGVRVSPMGPCFPRGQGPPWVRTSRPASRLLPASSSTSRGPGARASRSTPRMPGPGFQGPGLPLCFHTFRRPGFLYAFRGPDFQLSGDHVARLPGFFLASLPAFRLSGGHAFRRFLGGHASRLSGGFPVAGFQTSRLPLYFQGTMLSGCFQAFRMLSGFQETGARARASRLDFAYIK